MIDLSPITIKTLNKHFNSYYICYERLFDFIAHKVDGKQYFSNEKSLKDKDYIGEIMSEARQETARVTKEIIEIDDRYEVEITNLTVTFRSEKVIPKKGK